jgi:hypothetical protein
MHDDAHALLDTLGIPKRSETGADFTLQHRIGLLNDDAEREKGAAYRDAAAAEASRDDLARKSEAAEQNSFDTQAALKRECAEHAATKGALDAAVKAKEEVEAERDALQSEGEKIHELLGLDVESDDIVHGVKVMLANMSDAHGRANDAMAKAEKAETELGKVRAELAEAKARKCVVRLPARFKSDSKDPLPIIAHNGAYNQALADCAEAIRAADGEVAG